MYLETEAQFFLNYNLKGENSLAGLTNAKVLCSATAASPAGFLSISTNSSASAARAVSWIRSITFPGRVPLTARGVLRTKDGKGQFQLTAAEIHRVPIPKPLVQELVTFFSRTRENPRGIDIDEPFSLPAKIREIVVNQGEAVVVQ